MIQKGMRLQGHLSDGEWIDIGRPKDLIRINQEMSAKIYPGKDWSTEAYGTSVSGRSYIGYGAAVKSSKIDESIISEGCNVDLSEISGSMLMAKCQVFKSKVTRSVLGEGCKLEEGSSVSDSVLADGTVVGKGERIEGQHD